MDLFFSHELASFCQFLDVDIASNCVLKTKGAKAVWAVLSGFGVLLDRAKSWRLASAHFCPSFQVYSKGKNTSNYFT